MKPNIYEKPRYKCLLCGHIHDDANFCDKCKAGKDHQKLFTPVRVASSTLTWADSHIVGEGALLPADLKAKLKACFTAETTEVGMYNAMSRAAAREGFPEIAETFRTIAKEEAFHATRFCELIGDLVKESTKENLIAAISGENGACALRKQIATESKKLGYDAVHDFIHEASKDEARHGTMFLSLLNRYFDEIVNDSDLGKHSDPYKSSENLKTTN